MRDYIIFTDSGADISPERVVEWGVKYVEMTFRFDGEDKDYRGTEMPNKDFYQKMRSGGVAKTAAVGIETFKAAFEEELKKGNDILHIGFSSGLSNTVNAGMLAAQELAPQYPDQKIIVVDTLCASAGQTLMVWLALNEKKNGAPIEAVAQFVRDTVPHLDHWFTVDDLVYLKRGGRVSAAAAFAAGVLNLKPVLHVDDEGHLINMMKIRGRKQSIKALADKYKELANDLQGVYFISHGDCLEDAKALEDQLAEISGHKAALIETIGPVIGAHAGPGTLALFFVGKNR